MQILSMIRGARHENDQNVAKENHGMQYRKMRRLNRIFGDFAVCSEICDGDSSTITEFVVISPQLRLCQKA
jgi:hypothetical protein